jgi:hypothetical protein
VVYCPIVDRFGQFILFDQTFRSVLKVIRQLKPSNLGKFRRKWVNESLVWEGTGLCLLLVCFAVCSTISQLIIGCNIRCELELSSISTKVALRNKDNMPSSLLARSPPSIIPTDNRDTWSHALPEFSLGHGQNSLNRSQIGLSDPCLEATSGTTTIVRHLVLEIGYKCRDRSPAMENMSCRMNCMHHKPEANSTWVLEGPTGNKSVRAHCGHGRRDQSGLAAPRRS